MENRELALTHPEWIQISGGEGCTYYGADQEWFGAFWKKQAGCGPTVASNLMLYQHRAGRLSLPVEVKDVPTYVELMEAVWCHVTPNMRGVSTLSHFCSGVHGYLRSIGQMLSCNTLEVPRPMKHRPDVPKLAAFLEEALQADSPVAFLIRSDGAVENLEAWHWITIVSFAHDAEAGSLTAEVYNNSKPSRVDLVKWLCAPGFGGGFVYFG